MQHTRDVEHTHTDINRTNDERIRFSFVVQPRVCRSVCLFCGRSECGSGADQCDPNWFSLSAAEESNMLTFKKKIIYTIKNEKNMKKKSMLDNGRIKCRQTFRKLARVRQMWAPPSGVSSNWVHFKICGEWKRKKFERENTGMLFSSFSIIQS